MVECIGMFSASVRPYMSRPGTYIEALATHRLVYHTHRSRDPTSLTTTKRAFESLNIAFSNVFLAFLLRRYRAP